MDQDYLEGILEHRLLGPCPKESDSVSLGCGLGICISNKFSDIVGAAAPETTL